MYRLFLQLSGGCSRDQWIIVEVDSVVEHDLLELAPFDLIIGDQLLEHLILCL